MNKEPVSDEEYGIHSFSTKPQELKKTILANVVNIVLMEQSRRRVTAINDDSERSIEQQLTKLLKEELFHCDKPILDNSFVSYVTVTNPNTRLYDTGAKLGTWGSGDHKIWDKTWMGDGVRNIDAGSLFKELKSVNENDIPYIPDWEHCSIVSEATKPLNIESALVLPLRFSNKNVGFFRSWL